ncbi:hypothetical protein EN836_24100 [Mesorhizobium sp. M1C.F.Ca.ET.193.01.1.1]|uniref:hypothetical protein n=1 Tax=unclassified Mesorhizobium TaxID=325217 RepID=UPI000FD4BD10|nr:MULTISPECIES: hypothetical protein [unclassified Mesorhizobium]TGS95129.1 hypothetical protein EN820_44345 [bacterium M00.F.Ca.ET.177.01.1.1]RWA63345.1 MAG: hypothetical protein EOQ28_30380 [Mesorhizobium sp.]RWB92911.1 MAG: hypothetical protein EOQ57_35510 [Mesorhizobium sp.]RWG77430.1 MAG: hypothetical protein EOQ69_29295 [Mesorhizobium sp.]RWK01967.1 MAG: hypothetical protein EOR42_21210 [Mesorhizobium sp.]
MPNRFDIFISRLESKTAREGTPPHPIAAQNGNRRDKADAKPVRNGEPHGEKHRGKHRQKHDA